LRRHAKASSAGSTSGAGSGPGRIGSFLAAAFLALLLIPAFASAAPAHPFLETFGSANQPSFGHAEGMAVDQSSGDLLVIDAGAGTLSRWKPDGSADDFSCTPGPNCTVSANAITGLSFASAVEVQVAVDNSGTATDGNIYVAHSNLVDVFGKDGTRLGQLTGYRESLPAGPETGFGYACGVTVDPAGNVYVGDAEGGVNPGVHKYEPSGAVPANGDNTLNIPAPEKATEPCILAAGAGPSAGSLFVTSYNGKVTKFNATTGAEDYEVSSGPTITASVDPSSGHLYAAQGGEKIVEFDASGSEVTEVTEVSSTPLASVPQGVAVNASTGDVYADRDRGSTNVEVFGPIKFPLTVKKAGNGEGTLTSTPAGISCGSQCTAEYREGKVVELKAEAKASSEFAGWSTISGNPGTCTGTTSPCQVTMGEATELQAEFNFQAGVIAITSLTPGQGLSEGGNSVEIKGVNFTGAESVKFGSSSATFSVESPTLIKATAPAGAPGKARVIVKAPSGESIDSEADDYTYVPSPPAVSAINPAKGPLVGGITVTITGANLAEATSVKFGATAATITEDTATQIKATAPACSEGAVHVTVTTAGGTSTTSPADEYTCVAAPAVSLLSPSKGPTAGAAAVTITGTNLAEATSVKFGSSEATITEDTATQIKVTTPSCLAGALHVTITTAGGTSATSAADEYTCVAAPTITSISPAKGPDEGGNQIEITGLNLSAASKVEFGSTVVNAPFLSNSATKLKVKVPAHAAGKVDVRVTTVGGTSAVVPADEYTFIAPPALSIAKAGTGSGSVSCDGGACKASYVFGTKVALTASADAGSTFAGFSGGGCSGTSCTLTLEADTTVTATFTANPPPAGGGGSTPPPAPAPTPAPAPKPLKCKKGFKKKNVHGKAKCVKVKHKAKKHHK
jgi:sugar lactone lactonase YvrE